MAFLQLQGPSGQRWADYVAAAPPCADNGGRLVGPWGECMNGAVVFEFCNDWGAMPGFEDGPGGQVISFCHQCGFGEVAHFIERAEEDMKSEIQAAQSDPFAFLMHRARNGMTWKEYISKLEPQVDKNGFVNGGWGECLTAAVIFEHQNPNWSNLRAYQEKGPAGQVFEFLNHLGHQPYAEQLSRTEDASHRAFVSGGRLPVFDDEYQAFFGQHPAQVIGGPPPQPTGRKKALLIGCNYPGTKSALRGCINDAHSWKNLLMELYGFGELDMVMLTDEASTPSTKRPTLANIRSSMAWLAAGAQPGDILFLQFSGHGTQRKCRSGQEADGFDEALCPTDYAQAGLLIDNEIYDIVVQPLQSGVKLTIILDCCHSGTAVDLPFIWGNGWEDESGAALTAGDVQMFSGCQDDQTSADVTQGGKSAGAMTMCMTKAIHENPNMRYPDLLARLHQILKEGGYKQRPRLTSSQRFDPSHKNFSLCDGAVPNMNPVLGVAGPPRHRPERPENASVVGALFGAVFG